MNSMFGILIPKLYTIDESYVNNLDGIDSPHPHAMGGSQSKAWLTAYSQILYSNEGDGITATPHLRDPKMTSQRFYCILSGVFFRESEIQI